MEPALPFSSSVALVTGAGSGIGRATSIKLASLGASLALCDINEVSVNETVAMCTQTHTGQSHLARAFDAGSTDPVNDFVAATMAKYGRIDHVFNCAGVNPTRIPLESTSDEYWSKLMNSNLKSMFNVTRACIPHLKTGASFVNVASISATKAPAGMAVYAATKAGIIGFSKSMALELGPRGIRTNVVAPGEIHTPSNSSVVAGLDTLKSAEERIAVGRFGEAEEVADVVVFLFGEGSRYMNGSVVDVNGGLS